MNFSEKLRAERRAAKLSQAALAEKAGISARTLQNYELGKRYPASMEIALRLAEALNVRVQDLLSTGEESLVTATGRDAKHQLREYVRAVSGLFSGGEIGQEDRDAAMEAIIAAYWAAKKENRRLQGEKRDEN